MEPAIGEPRWYNDPQLRALEFPDTEWLIDGTLPKGYTILVGAPKTGKTALMLPHAQDLAASGYRVAYLALDDNERRMKSRSIMASPDAHLPNLWYCFWTPDSADAAFEILDEWIGNARLGGEPLDLVVVDTYGVFVGARPKGDVFGFDYRMGQKFKALCGKHGTSILAAHHTRKGEISDEWLDMISGSAGMAASADAIWYVARTRGSREGVLRMTGNDLEERAIPLTLEEDMVWRASETTTPAQAAHTKCPRDILDALMEMKAATMSEIASETDHPRNTVRRALQDLKGERLVDLRGQEWFLTDHVDNALPTRPNVVRPQPVEKTVEPAAYVIDVRTGDTLDDVTEEQVRSGFQMLKASVDASRMHPIPLIHKDDRCNEPWSLIHEGMTGEHSWSREVPARTSTEVLVLDRNGSYPSAMGSVPVAANLLTHTGPLDELPPKTAGIFLVVIPNWDDARIGHPLGKIADTDAGQEWITTPHLKLLDRLAADGRIPAPVIRDSWTGRGTTGLFTAFSKEVQEQRLSAKDAIADGIEGAEDRYAEVKRSSSVAIRCLWPKSARSPFWRPDWSVSVRAEAAVRHWIRADQATQHGSAVIKLGAVDEVALIPPTHTDGLPTPYVLGDRYGQVKIKERLSYGEWVTRRDNRAR